MMNSLVYVVVCTRLFLLFDEVVYSVTALPRELHDILAGSGEAIVADAPIEEAHY